MSSRIGFKVEGMVQGVNFRAATTKQAYALGVSGFVKNASDGSVVGEAQGDEGSLKEFVEWLQKGPPSAKVSKVDQNEIKAKKGDKGFNVE